MRMSNSEVEMRCRIQQGANAWGKVEGSHVGQKHFEKAETESPESLCTKACLNLYLETVALTEQQQLKVGSGFVE